MFGCSFAARQFLRAIRNHRRQPVATNAVLLPEESGRNGHRERLVGTRVVHARTRHRDESASLNHRDVLAMDSTQGQSTATSVSLLLFDKKTLKLPPNTKHTAVISFSDVCFYPRNSCCAPYSSTVINNTNACGPQVYQLTITLLHLLINK